MERKLTPIELKEYRIELNEEYDRLEANPALNRIVEPHRPIHELVREANDNKR